ncbi:hypothetical protein AAE02nite_07720 [Adhaeribacter aerolatus]|uniref:Cell division protein n=1 Tax=Adhaeribacter aerolatus TaxID=670289 RepID=A0A512ATS7_9BACT|nr:SRPBCC family protein [Adhaeribacter aerolatus]GEO03108.1 hypothetical protein AAE02nite_07720 [Adhaeribacter aerolatus]
MPEINIRTFVKAPIQICFDLSRSIDLHQLSTQKTGEKAIAGRTTGLIELHETVTWRAKHFGVWQKLTSKITAFNYPFYFEDQMVSGAFKYFRHEHHFTPTENGTQMQDKFYFEAPFGLLGTLANKLFLEKYMLHLLEERNAVIKAYAESGNWRLFLSYPNEAN